MYDAAYLSEPATLQRAVGELRVALRRRDGTTVLQGLRQAGCLKARFPRPVALDWADVVTLNTSGGVAGGDRLDSRFEVHTGAQASISAQAAERFYRALPGSLPSQVRTSISVADAAALEWLPQETILFDRCALDRRLDVELAQDSWFLAAECLVFGRAAMGETVTHAWLHDTIRIRRDGRLILHDAIRLEGEVANALRRKAIADGAGAIATIIHVAPDAEAKLDALRRIPLPQCGRAVELGSSAWDGMLLTRILAPDGASLRAAVTAALRTLRGSRPLPRVWLC